MSSIRHMPPLRSRSRAAARNRSPRDEQLCRAHRHDKLPFRQRPRPAAEVYTTARDLACSPRLSSIPTSTLRFVKEFTVGTITQHPHGLSGAQQCVTASIPPHFARRFCLRRGKPARSVSLDRGHRQRTQSEVPSSRNRNLNCPMGVRFYGSQPFPRERPMRAAKSRKVTATGHSRVAERWRCRCAWPLADLSRRCTTNHWSRRSRSVRSSAVARVADGKVWQNGVVSLTIPEAGFWPTVGRIWLWWKCNSGSPYVSPNRTRPAMRLGRFGRNPRR